MDKTTIDESPKPAESKPDVVPLRPMDDEIDLKIKNPWPWLALAALPLFFIILFTVLHPDAEPPPPAQKPKPAQLASNPQGGVVSDGVRPLAPEMLAQNSASKEGGAGSGSSEKCDFSPWVGLKPTDDILEAVKASSRPLRILTPNSPMTMDHSPARINFDLDEQGIITRVWCG